MSLFQSILIHRTFDYLKFLILATQFRTHCILKIKFIQCELPLSFESLESDVNVDWINIVSNKRRELTQVGRTKTTPIAAGVMHPWTGNDSTPNDVARGRCTDHPKRIKQTSVLTDYDTPSLSISEIPIVNHPCYASFT
ncbi:hypothetical protein HHI36_013851 [Cryptolaemus montrouzieri]|uniref:Uncharacterized protein n=1 Tax=Cryptolaemus montrouzieri TaxID=559131 RepID=A0ABD2N0Q9_9CUCU